MRVAACAVIVCQGRVLLGRRSHNRSYYPGSWDLFGGHVEPDEHPDTTLIRKLSEELGIVPVDARAVLVESEPKPEANGQGEFHVYLVERWIGEPRLRNSEHDQLGWFTLTEAAGLDLADKAILDVLGHVLDDSGTLNHVRPSPSSGG